MITQNAIQTLNKGLIIRQRIKDDKAAKFFLNLIARNYVLSKITKKLKLLQPKFNSKRKHKR